MEKRTLQKLGLLCASVALCSAASWWSGNNETEQQVQKLTEQPIVEQTREIKITVCISGAVAKPGLYEVTKGSRAQQVIELAGGVTEEADLDRVNLAQLCKDGGHIKVPRLSKARQKQKIQEQKLTSGAGISGEFSGPGQHIVNKDAGERKGTTYSSRDAGKGHTNAQNTGSLSRVKTGANDAGMVSVHLNSATEAELVRLPGVGNATAQRIISFRNRHGFQRIEDVMKIPGIGPAKFVKMKPYLVL